jgi:pyrrolidone-carboxylate peptidase
VFLTGYGDFKKYNRAEGRINPSAKLAEVVAQMGVRNAEIHWRELPVTMEGIMVEVWLEGFIDI